MKTAAEDITSGSAPPTPPGSAGAPTTEPAEALLGRRAEQQAIEQTLTGAAQGRGRALVLRGPAGIGKTALLAYATRQARAQWAASSESREGHVTVEARGVRAERGLPFACLQWLLQPIAQHIEGLAGAAAAQLQGILYGQADSDLPVGPALLSLLTRAAEQSPVLVVVDDLQWVDPASAAALTFVARRARAHRLALFFALRDPDFGPVDTSPQALDTTGLDELRLAGLSPEWSGELLGRRHPDLAQRTCRTVLAQAAGNPQALQELPAMLGADQRAGLYGNGPLVGTRPQQSRAQDEVIAALSALPASTQDLLLLVAAAGGAGDLRLALRAVPLLGVSWDDMTRAEQHRLAQADDGQITLTHPLAIPAIYQAAPLARRSQAHKVMAQLEEDPALQVWHRAADGVGPDEKVAAGLARVAGQAFRDGSRMDAAVGYDRAAGMTADSYLRARWLLDAAEAAALAGLTRRATHVTERALAERHGRTDSPRGVEAEAEAEVPEGALPDLSGQELRLLALLGAPLHDHRARHRSLLETAVTLPAQQHDVASELLTAAVEQAWYSGDAALAAEAVGHPASRSVPTTAYALAELLDGTTGPAWSALRSALDTAAPGAHDGPWGEDLSLLVAAPEPAPEGSRAGRVYQQALGALLAGRFRDAASAANDALTVLAEQPGDDPAACCLLHRTNRSHWLSRLGGVVAWLAAVDGATERCRSLAAGCFELADTPRPAAGTAVAHWALGLLDLGHGRYEEALARLAELADGPGRHLVVAHHALPDLVEAAARAGRPEQASDALARLAELARHSTKPWLRATLARSRALLAADDEAETHFREALDGHERAGHLFELGRTRLSFGEWLRRAARRREARAHLEAASELFAHVGAVAWVERARSELRAAGYTAQGTGEDPAAAELLGTLTPQELQVVELAAAGASNREIAARLYISPRTVGYHLYKAFPKLKVTSRRELGRLFS